VKGFPATPPSSPRRNATGAFSEASAWSSVGAGWRPLHGNFRNLGYSIEWHDFTAQQDFDWSRSFHPGSVEICLNLAGSAEVRTDGSTIEFASQTAGFYFQNKLTLRGVRRGGERHQFITIELSREFVQRHIGSDDAATHPRLATFLARRNAGASVSEATPLTSDHRAMVMSLRKPQVFAAAQRLWYHAKAHTYRIVVSDLLRGRPIWFGGQDRSEASMDQFYAWLGTKKCPCLKLAVMDMWKPFRLATRRHAPEAAVLFDKFHIMRHVGEALDQVRKQEYARLTGSKRPFIQCQNTPCCPTERT
jgi:hypothetical protein